MAIDCASLSDQGFNIAVSPIVIFGHCSIGRDCVCFRSTAGENVLPGGEEIVMGIVGAALDAVSEAQS